MLGLKLREEFRGKLLKGTAIELANDSKTGATQVGAQAFLGITYPTHDLVKAIEAIGPAQARPVAVFGERGAGKSHVMAALYHAVSDPSSTRRWLEHWAKAINAPELATIKLRSGMLVIGDSLHRQRYKFLWDVLLENHPHGVFIRGKWQGAGAATTDILPHALVVELLEKQPVMLLLDEFQTWFDGLANTEQQPTKNWAFTFIQILSEIAKERPDLLVLVISVRNGNDGQAVVVAGLDTALDALLPADAEVWLTDVLKPTVLSFQQHFGGGGALVFWLPTGRGRIKVNAATDAVSWACPPPHQGQVLPFGRILWGEAGEYPQELVLHAGGKPAGLYHGRIT